MIDCDSHVLEPPDLWTTYLEERYVDRAIRIEEVDGVEQLIIGEQVVLAGVLAGLGGAHKDKAELFTPGNRYLDGCPPASYDPDARILWRVSVNGRSPLFAADELYQGAAELEKPAA